jgi:hypothetical protein
MPQIEIYKSSNGDSWSLCRNEAGNLYVVHEPNQASGGKASTIEVGAFLSQGHGPQHQALLKLIATLVDKQRD